MQSLPSLSSLLWWGVGGVINVGCQGYMGGSFIKRPSPATSQKSIYQHLMKSVQTKCPFAGRELRESWFVATRYNSEVTEARAERVGVGEKEKSFSDTENCF